MKFKLRLFQLRKQLTDGTLIDARPQLAIALGWTLNLILGFVLSLVTVMQRAAPFGVAVAARAGGGISGLMCALGASLGYILAFGVREGTQQIVAVVLVYTTAYVFQDTKLCRGSFFLPAIAAFFTLLTAFLGFYTASAGEILLLPLALTPILAFGATYFFREALRTERPATPAGELRRGISLAVLLACLLMALSGAVIFDTVSLGRVLCVLLIQAAAFRGGPLVGAALGILLGAAMDAVSAQAVFFALAFPLSALISGVFSRHGRLVFLLSYILCGALAVILCAGGGVRAELLYENFAASVIFMVLPNSVLNTVGELIGPADNSAAESALRRYTANRIRAMGQAFSDLYTTVDGTLSAVSNDEDISQVFDRAAELVCSKCKQKSACWNERYIDTLTAMNDASAQIQSNGILRSADLPEHFVSACLRPEELVSAVNGELRGRTYRRQFSLKLNENRAAAYQQYLDLSEILNDVSLELSNVYGPDPLTQRRLARYLSTLGVDADIAAFRDRSGRLHILIESVKLQQLLRVPAYLDLISDAVGVRLCRPGADTQQAQGRIVLLEAEPLTVSVGVASMKKKGETVSGDRGTYFKTEQGVLCILLSDGMGSGEDAAKESVAAVRILERFLRSGVEPGLAMKMLNSVMLLKNSDSWGFATVDLLCIDLFSGEAAFYKYGAAPSYVRAGKQIRRVRSKNLAAGLSAGPGALPDIVKMRLSPGCLAVIASDGVIAETNDAWLRKLLAGTDTENMKDLAKETLRCALRLYGQSDDMTVLTVRVDQRV